MTESLYNDVSLVTGFLLVCMCFLVIKAFRWQWTPGQTSEDWLRHGIAVLFLSVALNALYWAIILRASLMLGYFEIAVWLRQIGGYADVILKGGAIWAGYCFLRSVYLDIPTDERRGWTVLGIPWYPRKVGTIARLLNGCWRGR